MQKNINKPIRHGDVDIIPLSMTSLKSIPSDAYISPDGKTVMHGESGHQHKLQSGQVLVLNEPVEVQTEMGTEHAAKFLHVPQTTTIRHEEHTTLQIPKGNYVVLQEREMDHMTQAVRNVMD